MRERGKACFVGALFVFLNCSWNGWRRVWHSVTSLPNFWTREVVAVVGIFHVLRKAVLVLVVSTAYVTICWIGLMHRPTVSLQTMLRWKLLSTLLACDIVLWCWCLVMLSAKVLLQIQPIAKLLRADVTNENFAFVVMIGPHVIPHLLERIQYSGTHRTHVLFLWAVHLSYVPG